MTCRKPKSHSATPCKRDFLDLGNVLHKGAGNGASGEVCPWLVVADGRDAAGEIKPHFELLSRVSEFDFCKIFVRLRVYDILQKPDFDTDRCGHLIGHTVEMALDKLNGHQKLQAENRQNQNQRGSSIEAARHVLFDPAKEHIPDPNLA